ncbi:MAG: hypothetical protein NTW67_02500 [Candidatus Woesearchaeota archaeon]|nr:hypothetical protein [Candidatus Woesearchaeota archaeon]
MNKPRVLLSLDTPDAFELVRDLPLDSRVDVFRGVSSVENCPAIAEHHAIWNNWDAIVADSVLNLAFLLSSHAERPVIPISLPLMQGYCALSVGDDQFQKAVGFAADLLTQEYKRVVLYTARSIIHDPLPFALLGKLGVAYYVDLPRGHVKNPKGDELPLLLEPAGHVIAKLEEHKRYGLACSRSIVKNHYIAVVDSDEHIALLAARVIARHDPDVAKKLQAYYEEQKEKYEPFRAVIPLRSVKLGGGIDERHK